MIQTPQACWEIYKEKNLPRGISQSEMIDSRRAFMAGMIASECVITDIDALIPTRSAAERNRLGDGLTRIALAYAAQAKMRADR